MAVRRVNQPTYQRRDPASGTRASLAPTIRAAADAATFGVLVVAAIALPSIFSIENADVFAMPKAVVAIGLAAVLTPLLALRWLAASWTLDDLRRRPLVWAIVAFVTLNLLAAAFAVDRQHALFGEKLQFQGLATTLAYVVFLLAAWTSVRTSRRRTMLLWAVAVAAAVSAGYAIVQRLGLDPIWDMLIEGRVFSTFGQPNWLAAFFVTAIPLTVALAAGRHLVVQALLAVLAVAEMAALAFTLSRGGFLGAVIAALVMGAALLAWRPVVTRRGVVLTALTAIVVAGGLAAIPQTRDAAAGVAQRIALIDDVEEPSASAHLDQWAVGVAIAADNALIGAGQDSYVLLFGDYRDDVLPADRARIWEKYRPESPHNHFLAIAGGMGVPALVAYLAIIGAAVVRGIRGVRLAAHVRDGRTAMAGIAFLAVIAGHLVTDSFMTAEVAGSVLFWIVLGASAALGSARADVPREATAEPT
jgi:O-antigen ligase